MKTTGSYTAYLRRLNYIAILKDWWLSLLLAYFVYLLVYQHYMAIEWEISFAYRFDYPWYYVPLYYLSDGFLLIIHEAGHTLFGIAGNRFITILGGTLMELFIPLLIIISAGYLHKPKTRQCGLLLLAMAFLETAAYAADATERRMPLIGNLPASSHDFYNLFQLTNTFEYVEQTAFALFFTGLIVSLAFLLHPLMQADKDSYIRP